MPPKPKRGVSLEEKRTKLLEFFTREHTFFNIKEIESQGSKFTGVHAMQMKELLQSLVDDGLVNAEKCGITVVYWCFEYDKIKKVKDMIQKKQDKLDATKKSIMEVQQDLNKEKGLRLGGDTGERVKLWRDLQMKRDQLKIELESSVFDDDRVNEIKNELQSFIDCGETCTDNIESMLYHFQKQNGIERSHFQTELGIPEEFKEFANLNKAFDSLK